MALIPSEGPARSHRVLLVDDSGDASRALADLLTLRGHSVHHAADGASALVRARDLAPHVIVLDIGLPDMSGFDVARQLRGIPELSGTILIALTGYGSAADRARAHHAGFDHHFTKPLDFPALDRLLSDIPPPATAAE